ncbi:ABC transporter permease [Streptomyces triticagri]|uniref:ABC transporter permease n=1 Tax=Streptomyces triticagri TaxID=2293568 RepID=A0A372M422_9ACTN|nr:ABC transporter permease [Streptomyces triticagri]RFU85698.1 ABC transporter permease [Streptomyces triticagri]
MIVALALWAFAWPAARTAPHELPVGVAGPAAAADGAAKQLEARDGAFEVHRYADEAAARDAIEDRTVYGAVVVTPSGPKLLTASAAGPVVAQLLTEAVTAGAPEGTQVQTDDVVAAPAADPRGAALGASVLPMSIAGVAAGAVVTVLGLRGVRAALALVATAAATGAVAAALTHSWLGVVAGNWWAEAGAFGLAALAVSATVAGFAALAGPAGIGVGALLMVLLGNPFSGVSSAPELLPEPAGLIGQWLPPGAGGTLMRSVAFFDGAGGAGAAVTLGIWAAVGLAAVLIGARTRRSGPTSLAAESPEAAVRGTQQGVSVS